MSEWISRPFSRKAEKTYAERLPYLGSYGKTIDEKIQGCTEEEKTCLRFFYGSMPLSDAASYPFSLYLSFVRHGILLRHTVPWCRDLPEDIFVRNVLYYRVNSEKIEDCRPFFFQEVYGRIKDLSMEQAVLQCNVFACEHVTYRASDERTLSPLTVYRSGDGRCGEESVFLVNVLRSVGIPARQVYVPLWAHCDDNHAWCEVRLPDGWHYLGACEPEPVLDRGWFDGAASRAMLVHAREFTDYRLPDEKETSLRNQEDGIGKDHGVYFLNRTGGYADTVNLKIQVTDKGRPAAQADVFLYLLNYAEFGRIASLQTDESGACSIRLGRGSLWIVAQKDGRYAAAMVDTEQIQKTQLELQDEESFLSGFPENWKEFLVRAPREHILYAGKPTPEQMEERSRVLAECARIRDSIERTPPFDPGSDPERQRFLSVLSEKDRKDVTEKIYRDALKAKNEGYPGEIYDRYVFSERIGKEELTPWRAYLDGYFSKEEKKAFRKDPGSIGTWVHKNIRYVPELDYPTIVSSPEAVLSIRQGNPQSQRILMCALARTMNIPARLDPVTGEAQWYDRNASAFVPFKEGRVNQEKADAGRKGTLILHAGGQHLSYGKNWTLSVFDRRVAGYPFRTLRLEESDAADGEGKLDLPAGIYVLLTAARDPSGNLHAKEIMVRLEAGKTTEVPMELSKICLSDLVVSCRFDNFAVRDITGKESTFFAEQTEDALAVFLEPGKEPTEHVLNELLEERKNIPEGFQIFLFPQKKENLSERTLSRVLSMVPSTVLFEKDPTISGQIARHLYEDPEKLPLLMLLKKDHTCIFGSSGYRVGSVALALEIERGGGMDESSG